MVSGCSDDFLNTQPTDKLSKDDLDYYMNQNPDSLDALVTSYVNGLYATMITYQGNHDVFGQKAVDLSMDLQGMDMVQTIHHWFGWDYLMENRDFNYRRVNQTWIYYYQLILAANNALKVLPDNPTTDKVKALKGQALGVRAFAYYYLVRIYQFTYDGHQQRLGVPVYRNTGDEDGSRLTVAQVYDGIIEDFTNAYQLLEGISLPNTKFNANAVALYLADAHLTMKNYQDAAFYAEKVRTAGSLMSKDQYKLGFNDLANPEVVFGVDVTAENTTYYASFFSHMSHYMEGYALADGYGGPYAPKAIYSELYNLINVGDVRKELFNPGTDPKAYINKKFLQKTGFLADLIFARTAEAYLIEAEAKSHFNEAGAKTVLEQLITARSTFNYNISGLSGDALREAIQVQKRIELWGEGRVQFDRKRLKLGVDRAAAPGNHRPDALLVFPWNDKTFVFAMPKTEIDNNANLILDENQ